MKLNFTLLLFTTPNSLMQEAYADNIVFISKDWFTAGIIQPQKQFLAQQQLDAIFPSLAYLAKLVDGFAYVGIDRALQG